MESLEDVLRILAIPDEQWPGLLNAYGCIGNDMECLGERDQLVPHCALGDVCVYQRASPRKREQPFCTYAGGQQLLKTIVDTYLDAQRKNLDHAG